MVFTIISRLVNGVKEGVKAGLEGVSDVSGAIVDLVKNTTVSMLKGTTEVVTTGVDAAGSVVKGAISGVADIGAGHRGGCRRLGG